jgi:uncharacterized protein
MDMVQALWPSRVRALTLLLAVASIAACREKEQTELEMEVRSVGFDDASHAPVVVLQDHDRKIALPIWIGPAEAQSIAMQIEGINPPRPMTHDLVKTILDDAGVELQRVLIQELKGSTYYASIFLHSGRRDWQVDSRPSDAIALAVRFHKPIFVATALMKGDGTITLQRAEAAGTTIKFSGVTVQNLSAELADYFQLPPGRGVLVADVGSGAPPGLQRGDIVLEVEGAAVTGVGDFAARMQAVKDGAAAHLSVQRGAQRLAVEFIARAQ